MPNYCNNSVFIYCDDIVSREIIEYVKSEDNEFDFNKIVPMPANIYDGPLGSKERELYDENNWYDWSVKNWGTKWNSVDAEIDGNEIAFLTAWSDCSPVIEALSKKFPGAVFEYSYYETGLCFCGKFVFKNGKLLLHYEGDYFENPLWEEDSENAKEYELIDNRFEISETDIFRGETCDLVQFGDAFWGKLFYREYGNGKIVQKTDGAFVVAKDYLPWCQHIKIAA